MTKDYYEEFFDNFGLLFEQGKVYQSYYEEDGSLTDSFLLSKQETRKLYEAMRDYYEG